MAAKKGETGIPDRSGIDEIGIKMQEYLRSFRFVQVFLREF
jgi:hypothetical protein